MIAMHRREKLSLAAMTVTIAMLTGVSAAPAAVPPVKLVPASHIGWEVDEATKGEICTVASKDKCQPGKTSSEPGGFEYPEGIAVAPDGNIYVADRAHYRVQELTPAGAFVLMFGKDVNETTGGDVCSEEEIKTSGVKCKSGVEGTGAGAFAEAQSVSIDQSTGEVYVQDLASWRVDEYTADGQFVLMIGKEVNETKDKIPGSTEAERNICSAASVEVCKAGVQSPQGSTEKSVFKFAQGYGNVIAAGGPEHLLYVGDEDRVQVFEADGEYKREIPLTSISSEPGSLVLAIAVDETGNMYIVYRVNFIADVVHEFNPEGKEVKSFQAAARKPEVKPEITASGLDSAGHLALGAYEIGNESGNEPFGLLYIAATGHLVTFFVVDGIFAADGVAFNGNGELYLANSNELTGYFPKPVAELLTSPATCAPGAEHETLVTLECVLGGTVNPEGVSETEASFEWGRTPLLGSQTPRQLSMEPPGSAPEPVNATISNLRPNEAFFYQLAGNDQSVKQPEQLTSEETLFVTPAVPPKVVGTPSVSFVTSSSAVMAAHLNPENSKTEYFFEYGPRETLADCPGLRKTSCPGVVGTGTLESRLYGLMGATLEASGLQPDTDYGYRLAAVNEAGESPGSEKPEGHFTTALAPSVQAETGSASDITATSALVSGIVNPDGRSATYAFELGIYQGATTRYGTVFSGPTGTALEAKSLMLTGLQPGTEYAYQIEISSGYGTATGATVRFKTTGLPAVLVAPAPLTMLPVPTTAFPKQPLPSCKHGYTRDKQDKCVKPKKKIKTKKKKTKPRKKKTSK